MMKLLDDIKLQLDNLDNIGFWIEDDKGNIVEHNSREKFETASCIKVFILLEYFRQLKDRVRPRKDKLTYRKSDRAEGSGDLQYLNPDIEMTVGNFATLMMIRSDNSATNMMIDYLGIDNINQTIREIGLKNTKLLNRIDFSKSCYVGISTPYESGLIFRKLLNYEVLNPELCEEMLGILKKNQTRSIISKGLPLKDWLYARKRGPLVYVASKSGGLGGETYKEVSVRNDIGVISTTYGNLVVSVFVKNIKDPFFYDSNKGIIEGSKVIRLAYSSLIGNQGALR